MANGEQITILNPVPVEALAWEEQGRVVSINQGRMGETREWAVNPTLNYRGEGATLYTAIDKKKKATNTLTYVRYTTES